MTRVRLFNIEWKSSFEKVCERIIAYGYSETKSNGFKIYKKRTNYMMASYIEKIEIEEIVNNPITNSNEVFKRITFEENKFILENNRYGLRFINPTRKINEITNIISSLSNFNISVKSMLIDLNLLFKHMEEVCENLIIKYIDSKNISISDHTILNIEVKSTLIDVRNDLNTFFENKSYKIKKAKCSFLFDEKIINLEISDNMLFKIHTDDVDTMLLIIKNSLIEMESK